MGIERENAVIVVGDADAIRLIKDEAFLALEQGGAEIIVTNNMVADLIQVLQELK